MNTEFKKWRNLFLFCLGLFTGTAFCMKWMESDFIYNDSIFTIIGLEATYSKEKVVTILSGIDEHVKKILLYHLYFDFSFMAGVYPGIASLCMMARSKITKIAIGNLLLALAIFQLIAWGCDIAENLFLLNWVNNPQVGNDFMIYHTVVFAKWIIALTGAMVAIPLSIKKQTHY